MPPVPELAGLVSGERLAWFSESCGPLPDPGATTNAPRVASPTALRGHRPSGIVAAGNLTPLGWLGHVFSVTVSATHHAAVATDTRAACHLVGVRVFASSATFSG
jgi:hypothetical protein